MDNHFVVIKSGFMGHRFAWVLWRAGELKGLGSVKCCAKTNFSCLVRVYLLVVKEEVRRRNWGNWMGQRTEDVHHGV